MDEDRDAAFVPGLDDWLDAADKKKATRVAKIAPQHAALDIPREYPQVIHATKTVGGVSTVEHVDFTVENWQAWVRDPTYARMYTHPTSEAECVSPVEVVKRAREKAGQR